MPTTPTQTVLITECTLGDIKCYRIFTIIYMHMGFQMTLLLEVFVTHSLHMHGFHPACISYVPQTCGTIKLTVLYYRVASEYDEGDDISDRMTAYTCHK